MMSKIYISITIVFLVLILTSCESKIVNEPVAPINNNEMSSKFSDIQTKLFNVSCALSGCHSGSNPSGNLNLTSGSSYNQLVNVNSRENPSIKRVLPSSSSQSLLIRKLEGNGTTIMPPSGKLSQKIIDSVKVWIDKGALNN